VLLETLFVLSAIQPPAPVVLDTREAINEEHCRLEFRKSYCGGREESLRLFFVPEPYASQIHSFVSESLKRRYARALSLADLFHGHAISKGPQTHYESFAAYLKDIQAYLFHSAEEEFRWAHDPEKVPRSFVGMKDGSFAAAVDLVGESAALHSHQQAGTIYAEEVVAAHPGLSDHKYNGFGTEEPVFVRLDSGEECELNSMFFILQMPEGRFRSDKGEPYDIYFHCKIDYPH
jgi:hypothetical protein